ncbi:hypothetical protein AB0C07_34160 [Actinoplanes missouriensis]|uniref:hypothetical protein n=1 Tax=Actinoplanes missouriensis TaxID=1866 RepID=UPI003403B251
MRQDPLACRTGEEFARLKPVPPGGGYIPADRRMKNPEFTPYHRPLRVVDKQKNGCFMQHPTRAITAKLTATLLAAVLISLSASPAGAKEIAPPSRDAGPAEVETMYILTPEEYQAQYLDTHGAVVPDGASEPLESEFIRNAAGELVDTETGDVLTGGGTVRPNAVDPGNGGGGTGGGGVPWHRALYSYTDYKGNKITVRYGTSAFGYHHFAAKHNLRNRAVFKTIPKNAPISTFGAKLTYEVWVGDPANGRPKVKIRFVSWQSSMTDDNKYRVPDAGYVGVITAFCVKDKKEVKGEKCPEWINKLK